MKVLLVEDDDLQAKWLCDEIERRFRKQPVLIKTESEFRQRLEEIAKSPPAVAVIDAMLRWAAPERDMAEVPEDSKDIYSAGQRCKRRLEEHPGTRKIPVIIYTVFDRQDLQQDRNDFDGKSVTYLQKGTDSEPLLNLINEFASSAGG